MSSEPDKEYMRRLWSSRGDAWDRWADTVAASSARMNEPLIAAAGIAAGQRVLDLASGAGQPALTIAELVGASGEVVATDLVPEMLEGARKRATARALGNMRFEFADMEALPFPDRQFDRVTCRFGIMFVPNAALAIREVRRVLVPGGRAAFMVWGPMADTTMFRIILSATDEVLGADAENDMSAVFRFAEPGSLSALFTRAGFVGVTEKELRLDGNIPVGGAFWTPQVEMSLGERVMNLPPEKRKALDGVIAERFAKEIVERPDGAQYAVSAHTRIVCGVAP